MNTFAEDFAKRTAYAVPSSEFRFHFHGKVVAGAIDGVYIILGICADEVEILSLYTLARLRGTGKARRALGVLVTLSGRHRLPLCDAPQADGMSPMDTAQVAGWLFRHGVRIIGGIGKYHDIHQDAADATGLSREEAKKVNFGIGYGMLSNKPKKEK